VGHVYSETVELMSLASAEEPAMNEENPIERQRLDGARQIVDFARNQAGKAGIKFDKEPIWNNGDAMRGQVNHILRLSVYGKTRDGEFPDEWLKDYPGVVGTERTRETVRAMIRELSQ